MADPIGLAQDVAKWALEETLPEALLDCRRERDFQTWLWSVVRERLQRQNPEGYEVRSEPDGGGIKPVISLGTSFWPDVAVYDSNLVPLLAVEVKCITRRNRASHISQPIGQALLYRQSYPECLVVLLLVEPPTDHFCLPSQLTDRLSKDNIEIVAVNAYRAGSALDG